MSDSVIYKRISLIGKIGRMFCSCLLVVCALSFLLVITLLVFGQYKPDGPFQDVTWYGHLLQKKESLENQTWLVRMDWGLLALVAWGFFTAGLWMMRRLFSLFHQGEVFSRSTSRLLLGLGAWNFASILLKFLIGDLALFPIPTVFFTGLLFLITAWTMELAHSIKREQDLTV